ncbi:SGNH/GDSL hydrolase family protein [Novosphingobium olei]|uniref:SGNH/GDSL hydrolase family protein n=1 Tax=Novosphingobium olei TaxID=2728851 RepID=A0A7Y0BNM1_9SPHN|nr:SGNH/GDSL hydrolase family protein [Novosphingobium olei]NML93821.1 SGNH/GDSL hydrolase family protein [Novosphingobium olei]
MAGNTVDIQALNLQVRGDRSIQERAVREGYPLTASSIGASNSGGGLAIGASLGGIGPGPGQAWFIESISLTSLIDVVVWVQRAMAPIIANGAASQLTPVLVGPNYGCPTITINSILREGESISFILRTTVTTGSGTDTFQFRAGMTGHRMTNDFAFEAPKVWLAIGDSITNTTGPTYGSEFYTAQVARAYRAQGKWYRRILKGDGGWQTAHAVIAMKRGVLDVPQADLVTLMLGTNELLLTDVQTNLPPLLAWMRDMYPSAKKCIIGAPPRQDSIETSVLQPVRSYAASAVSALNDPSFRFTSLATAFSAVGDTNYITTDGTSSGARVHPNLAGHTAMATALKADWDNASFV